VPDVRTYHLQQEEHLQRVAHDRGLKLKMNPTIGDLNAKIKDDAETSQIKPQRCPFTHDPGRGLSRYGRTGNTRTSSE
jgi:hypothetical protein